MRSKIQRYYLRFHTLRNKVHLTSNIGNYIILSQVARLTLILDEFSYI